ncbi:MAG: filamentous hemagglutinin N-terminal domain-containing protein [Pleurocapsa sp. MO_226.B13]|nr:filamentous hemagglutinin N-terminal domain-containing protein [Pleurocapsa sp. MO_226.B13]
MNKALLFPLQIGFCTVGYLYLSSGITQAQVSTDGTVNTQVNQNGNVAEITGGETRGSNLFHSFQDFSVPTGNEAFFDNASDISNIFSRVTGGNISNIDGLIRANGSASLFLINPAGIIFGENARLDIGGSFYGSSASSILFEDGEFSAVDNLEQPVLTINAPIGLSFRDEPGDIVNRSRVDNSGLEVRAGEDLALLGGDINLEGGLITASEGTITLGGLNATGEIDITETNSFAFPEEIAKSNVSLTQQARVDVRGAVGGSIQVNANNLEILETSNFWAGIPENSGSPNVQSGDVNFNLNNLIASGNSNIRNETLGIGNAGNINITTENLNLTEGAAIVASTFGQGDGGDVNINATGDVSIDRDFGGIYSTVGIRKDEREPNVANVVGDAGDITISANSFSLTNGGRILTKTAGVGNAGDVTINAVEQVSIDGQGTIPIEANDGSTFNLATAILTQVELEDEASNTFAGQGNAGNIEINTGSLLVTSAEGQPFGPQINTDNRGGVGNAGNVNLNATDSIVLEGTSQVNTEIGENASGDAGDINLTANSLSMNNNSQLLALTKGQGNAGNVNLEIADSVVISGGAEIRTQILETAAGNGGDISITTNSLTVKEDSQLLTSSNGEGNPGDINVLATGQIMLEGNNNQQLQLNTQLRENAIAEQAGNIEIQADSLSLSDRALLITSTRGNGNAGNISIQVNSFSLDNRSELSSVARGNGNSGDINLEIADSLVISGRANINTQIAGGATGTAGNVSIAANTLKILQEPFEPLDGGNRASILADNQGEGNAGNISIEANESVLLKNGILSSTIIDDNASDNTSGQSGNISINSPQVSLTDNAVISVSTAGSGGTGEGGNIEINSEAISVDNYSLIAASNRTNLSQGPGNITLNSDRVTLSNGGIINATTASDDEGGQININSQILEIFSGGVLQTATEGDGRAGDINLNISDRIIFDGRNAPDRPPEFDFADPILKNLLGKTGIFAGTSGDAASRGGNINIDSNVIVAFPDGNNDILANSQQGQGGNIRINAKSLLGIQERPLDDSTNDINASSEFGLDGSVSIFTPDVDPVKGTTELPSNVIEPEDTTAQACEANRGIAATSSLTIEGKGGIIPEPGLPLNSLDVIVNGETNPTSTIPEPIETSQGKIQPARGIKVTESGEIILTAYPTNNAGERIPDGSINCGSV